MGGGGAGGGHCTCDPPPRFGCIVDRKGAFELRGCAIILVCMRDANIQCS